MPAPRPSPPLAIPRHRSPGRIAALLAVSALSGATLPAGAQPLPELAHRGALGCVACGGAEAFGDVRGLALMEDGILVVLDRDPPTVRIFGPDGATRATFGSLGEGPGEMSHPLGVAAAGSTLVVGDLHRTALLRLQRDGTLAESVRLPFPPMGLRGDPTGRWVAYQSADWVEMTGGVVLLDAEMEEAGVPLPTTRGVLGDGEGRPAAPGLFSAAPGPDGRVAVGHGSAYRIVVLDPTGKVLHEIRRDVPRAPRTAAEIHRLEERLRAGPGAGRQDNPERGAQAREIDPLRPHFERGALAWDGEGRLWARTERGAPGTTIFDVFTPGGSFLGEVTLPVEIGEFTLGGGELAGVVTDPDLGVQSVHRWSLEEG